jgi:hypothetical protein
MTLGELFIELPTSGSDNVTVKIKDGIQTLATRRGMWMQDHILDLSEYEVTSFQWSKMSGWKVTVTNPLPFN